MTYARALAAVVMLAAVRSLPGWAAALGLVLVVAAFAVLAWWFAWRVCACRRGWVLSWRPSSWSPGCPARARA